MKKNECKKISAVLLTTALSLSLLNGSALTLSATAEDARDGQEVTEEQTIKDTTEDQTASGTSKEANEFDLPTLGLTVTMPDALMEKMEQGQVIMFTNEIPVEDNSAIQYGYLSWVMAEEMQLDAEDFNFDAMQYAGVLGVYRAELEDSLDELTGCDEHQEVGQSEDGVYKYFLSVNTSADEELVKEIQEIKAEITEMSEYVPYYGEMGEEDTLQPDTSVSAVGEFTTQDINGDTVTQDIFKENKLTMVNVFTTWCSPCVAEMPELEKLYQQMKDRNVGVVGVVLDVLNEKGEIVETDLERAQELVKETGVTYPVILPDQTYLNSRLTSIDAFPETFFVDENGNIVGETYSGSGSLEDWLEVVEKELANVEA